MRKVHGETLQPLCQSLLKLRVTTSSLVNMKERWEKQLNNCVKIQVPWFIIKNSLHVLPSCFAKRKKQGGCFLFISHSRSNKSDHSLCICFLKSLFVLVFAPTQYIIRKAYVKIYAAKGFWILQYTHTLISRASPIRRKSLWWLFSSLPKSMLSWTDL